MNLEEYTNSSECSLNCWIRWMHPLIKLSIVHVTYTVTNARTCALRNPAVIDAFHFFDTSRQ